MTETKTINYDMYLPSPDIKLIAFLCSCARWSYRLGPNETDIDATNSHRSHAASEPNAHILQVEIKQNQPS